MKFWLEIAFNHVLSLLLFSRCLIFLSSLYLTPLFVLLYLTFLFAFLYLYFLHFAYYLIIFFSFYACTFTYILIIRIFK